MAIYKRGCIIFRPRNAVAADAEMIRQFCKANGISESQFYSALLPAVNHAIHNFTRYKNGKIIARLDLGEIDLTLREKWVYKKIP